MPSEDANDSGSLSVGAVPRVELDVYPRRLRDERSQWVAWKADDGRKIPRAPWAHPEWPDKYVDAQDASLWTDFETAAEWAGMLAGHGLAYVIGDRGQHHGEDVVLVDYDDVRDPETGRIHPLVRGHVQRAGSYADVSPSGSGVHLLCRGQLAASVSSVAAGLPAHPAFSEAAIEVYDSARFVTMSGAHLVATPGVVCEAQSFINRVASRYGSVLSRESSAGVGEAMAATIERHGLGTVRGEDAGSEGDGAMTEDIQVVFRAIERVGPGDIRLDSRVTDERGDGSRSLDPSWEASESGTRIAQLDDGWVYRRGMRSLDALQLVALEERLVSSVEEYPTGKTFWEAVEALRDRGASIPLLVDQG